MPDYQYRNQLESVDEIYTILEDALRRELTVDERGIVVRWITGFNREQRGTIINMFKELVNKHSRID